MNKTTVMHVQSCCFTNKNLLLFAVLVAVALLKLLDHKFCGKLKNPHTVRKE